MKTIKTFTHSLCWDCWELRNGTKEPHRVVNAPQESCCNCQTKHSSGIYVREDPEKLACKGNHPKETV